MNNIKNIKNNPKYETPNVNCKDFFNNFTKCIDQKINTYGVLIKVNKEPQNLLVKGYLISNNYFTFNLLF